MELKDLLRVKEIIQNKKNVGYTILKCTKEP